MDIVCLSSVMVHPSSHNNTNDINGAIYIFGKMWICLSSLLRPGIWIVYICVDSIVLPYVSLSFISLSIIIGDVLWVACLSRCIFVPYYVISSMLVLVGLGGLSI